MPVRKVSPERKIPMKKGQVTIDEDDFKKIVLLLKMSKTYVKVPPENIQLMNLWRVSDKVADKLLKKNGMQMLNLNGRVIVKLVE